MSSVLLIRATWEKIIITNTTLIQKVVTAFRDAESVTVIALDLGLSPVSFSVFPRLKINVGIPGDGGAAHTVATEQQ